jgi:uncharacterized protein
MPTDHIRYDLLAQEALRSVVRRVLVDAATNGLPGEHHFYVTFDTRAPGLKISDRLKHEHPEEMTIVLQHQFWDLEVGEEAVSVTLSFQKQLERLTIPFAAIRSFADPSVNFALEFAGPPATPSAVGSLPAPVSAAKAPAKTEEQPEKPAAEVVTLDKFRKR